MVYCVLSISFCRRAANAARAMAALTSSTMSGVFPPIAAAMPLIPPMASVPPIIPAKGSFALKFVTKTDLTFEICVLQLAHQIQRLQQKMERILMRILHQH